MVIQNACVLHTVLNFSCAEILPTVFLVAGGGGGLWNYGMDKAVSLPVFTPSTCFLGHVF